MSLEMEVSSSAMASWAAFTCVTGALVCYYAGGTKYVGKLLKHSPATTMDQQQSSVNKKRQKDQSGRRKEAVARSAPPEKDTPPSYAEAARANNAPNNKKRKAGKGPVNGPTSSPAPMTQQADQDDEVDDDDRAWAQQLAATQAGVSLDKPSGKTALKRKGKEQKELAPTPPSAPATPELAPVSNDQTRSSGDVSDMLEAPAAGPSVIRITGEEQKKKQKAPKVPEVKESKKQRQNRRKVEEKAAQREADEKQRQILLENQRRSAREARGEPAKNGLGVANAPSNSAWKSGASTSNGATSAPSLQTNGTQLLDTFDHDAVSVSSSNDGPATDATTPATAASTNGDIPTEEAQIQMLAEMSGWSEVGTKKNKKVKGKPSPNSPPSETSSKASNLGGLSSSDLVNGSTSRASTPVSKQPPITKPAVQSKTNGYAALSSLKENTSSPVPPLAPVKGHPEDSEWAP